MVIGGLASFLRIIFIKIDIMILYLYLLFVFNILFYRNYYMFYGYNNNIMSISAITYRKMVTWRE